MATTLRTSGIQMGSSIMDVSGSAPSYTCRAWVNFDGEASTPSIRASGNVSSITRLGTGYHRVNFTTAMADANYSVGGLAQRNLNTGSLKHYVSIQHVSTSLATTSCLVQTQHSDVVGGETALITCVIVFR